MGWGFLILRQVEDTSIWRCETHTIRLPISEIKSPAIEAPRNLWLSTRRCLTDLTMKANSLPTKREHKQEQEDAI
jgi:hypothetical protein